MLVGHSLGALNGLAWALRAPERFDRLVLVGMPVMFKDPRRFSYENFERAFLKAFHAPGFSDSQRLARFTRAFLTPLHFRRNFRGLQENEADIIGELLNRDPANFAPITLIVGDEDAVYLRGIERLYDSLKERGFRVTLDFVRGADHLRGLDHAIGRALK